MLSRTLAAALLAFAMSATAADTTYVELEKRLTPEQRHATGLDTLSPRQLELLNAILREDAEQAAAELARTRADEERRRVEEQRRAAEDERRRVAEDRARADEERRRMELELARDAERLGPEKPLKAHAQGTVAGWEPGTAFVLDNGQTWKVLKGRAKLPRPLPDPEVTLVPGLYGRWFLQVTEDMPKARVYRVD